MTVEERAIPTRLPARSDDAAVAPPLASFRARAGGYVVDMVIFAAVAMITVVIAGFVLLLATKFAESDPSEPDMFAFFGIIAIGAPLAWTLLNVPLLALRGQTGGQYVAGVRLVRADGGRLSLRNALAWWFCFNPLLFSWPMALIAGLPAAGFMALIVSERAVFGFFLIAGLCLVAPVAALLAAAFDSANRTLYDRIVGTVVVPVE